MAEREGGEGESTALLVSDYWDGGNVESHTGQAIAVLQ